MSDDLPRSVASGRPRNAENTAPAGLAEELLDLAAAIKWVESQVTGSKVSARDALGAVERIQDITFALRECAVDVALCDALEAATREVADIISQDEAAAERSRSAAKLLGILAERIGAMIENAAEAAGEGAPGGPPPAAVAPAAPADAARGADRNGEAPDGDGVPGDAARPHAMPPLAAKDALATLRTLSAEELIALFS